MEIKEAAVYCGTYGKYNNASIDGAWMKLADYSDKEEFLEACAELHKDEHDPEFMFQDWENIPEGLVGESWIDERVWDLLDLDIDDDVLEAYFACFGGLKDGDDVSDIEDKINDTYEGEFNSDADFAYHFIENGCYEIPEWLECYVDFDRMGRDFAMDYYEHNGHYFRAY